MDASARSADRAEMDWMSADADRNHPLMLHCVSSPDRYSSKPVMNNTQGNTTDRLLGIVRSARRTGLRLADAIRVNELVGTEDQQRTGPTVAPACDLRRVLHHQHPGRTCALRDA